MLARGAIMVIAFCAMAFIAQSSSIQEPVHAVRESAVTVNLEELHAKLLQSPYVEGGTGVMIHWDEEKQEGYILTAYHVVSSQFFFGRNDQIHIIKRDLLTNRTLDFFGEIFAVSPSKDLALIKVKEKLPVFEVASDEEYRSMKEGKLIWGNGYPLDKDAVFVTVGFIINPDHVADNGIKSTIWHSTTGWHGFSGGPVVDPATGKLIGIEIRFGPVIDWTTGKKIPGIVDPETGVVRGQKRSYSSIAISALLINDFLLSVLPDLPR